MSSWFDRLLEELQRRQEEADARREGRPSPPREPRNVTPMDRRRRAARDGGAGGNGGDGGWSFPTAAGGTPWRRWVVIGGVLVGLLIVLGFVGGVVTLITDIMWYDALGQRAV